MNSLFDNPRFKKFMDILLKQADAGVPIEAQGFVDHPFGDSEMPAIEHQEREKQPEWVEQALEGWEPLR